MSKVIASFCYIRSYFILIIFLTSERCEMFWILLVNLWKQTESNNVRVLALKISETSLFQKIYKLGYSRKFPHVTLGVCM